MKKEENFEKTTDYLIAQFKIPPEKIKPEAPRLNPGEGRHRCFGLVYGDEVRDRPAYH
jgi:hypothetical protein